MLSILPLRLFDLFSSAAAEEADRRAFPPIPAAGFDLWRISVPQTAPVLDLPGQTLIEWHGAQRWLHSRTSDAAQVRAAAHAAGGSAALFISGDDSRRPFFDALAPPIERIHRGLKREFDPAGIFNRGRMFADW